MLTVLLDQDPRPDDDAILSAVVKAADPEHSGDTSTKIGILNLDALVYRVAAGSRAEMARVGDALLGQGFAAEHAAGVYFQRGFQTLYDRPPVQVVTYFRPSGHKSRRR